MSAMKYSARLSATLALTVSSIAFPGVATAAEYSAEPRLRSWIEHDSNIRMTEDEELSAMGTAAEAGLLLKRRTEVSSQEFDFSVRSKHYNRSEFSSEDQFFRWGAARNWERSTLNLLLNVDRDTTRDSELSDTGVILGSDRRERYYFQPSWSYSLSERQLISVSGSAEAIRYDNERYIGYDYGQMTLGWTWVSNERMSWFLQATYADYESKESMDFSFLLPSFPPLLYSQSYATESETYGLQAGGEYSWSEQLKLSVLVGRSRSENTYDINDPSQVCSIFSELPPEYLGAIGLCGMEDNDGNVTTLNASLEWSGERHRFTGSALSETRPSADGYLLETERLSVGWEYRVTEHARVFLDATYGRNEGLGNSSSQLGANRSDRDYIDARLRYRHQLTEQWFVEADYRYRQTDREIIPGVGESNAFMIGVRFEPQGWRWSR